MLPSSRPERAISRALGARLWLCLGLLSFAACSSNGGAATSPAPLAAGQCRSAADCGGGECEPTPTPSSVSPRPKVVAPCMMRECLTDEECGTGLVCGSESFGNCAGTFCGLACTPESCSDGSQCLASGHCGVLPCTDPEFIGCPGSTWYCDTAAAASPDPLAIGLRRDGSTSESGTVGAIESGCRQLRCDEPEGPSCLTGWECDTAAADAQSVGCVAIPCEELGHCSNDDYICEPTSTNTRRGAVDPHGCVNKNCEEGLACNANEVCDFASPDANEAGCRPVLCTEPDAICPGQDLIICDPESGYANMNGCRLPNCTEEPAFACTAGYTCEPSQASANSRGCVADGTNVSMPEPPNAGTSAGGTGSGNAGQTQVTSQGGTTQTRPPGNTASGAGGTPPDDTMPPGTPTQNDPPPVRADGAAEGAACSADDDCRAGYCVLGACRQVLGTCD